MITLEQFMHLGYKYGLGYTVKAFNWTADYSNMHVFSLGNLSMIFLYECRDGDNSAKITNPVELRYNGNGLTTTANFVERYLFVNTIDELKRLLEACIIHYKQLKKEYRINEIMEL